MNMLKYEQKYWNKGVELVGGIDEAGRGPLAGPVVAACVLFKKDVNIKGINDSKKLSEKKRNLLFDEILIKSLSVGIGIVHENKIDEINILQATYLAMKKSIGELKILPEQILIDGPNSSIKQFNVEHIINGDNKSLSIAAASIIAKVSRDRMMIEYDKIYPSYDFKQNKGYGTKYHLKAIKLNKISPIHRKSFRVVKENMPSYRYVEKKYGFDILSKQIVASEYIKQNYSIIDQNIIFKEIDDFIDLVIKKNKIIKFIKVGCIYKNSTKIKNNKDVYLSCIEKYIVEKDIKSKFEFIVIFVEFKKQIKPKIKILNLE